jgi:DNA-binding response OmpR family regulator
MQKPWAPRPFSGRTGGNSSDRQRPLALICDDEELILDLLEHHLTNQGFDVARASDGQQALDYLQHQVPDVAILDVMMPCVQGDEVLRRIRETPVWRHIPVLMLTMRTEEADVVSAFEVGASDYLGKPFTSAELVARVNRLVAPVVHPLDRPVCGPEEEARSPAPEIFHLRTLVA